METSRIDQFLLMNGSKFPPECIVEISEALKLTADDHAQVAVSYPYKDPTIAIILSVIIGSLGVDRFYVGDILLGILKLITAGGCGIWWFVDLFLIMGAPHAVKTTRPSYTSSNAPRQTAPPQHRTRRTFQKTEKSRQKIWRISPKALLLHSN